MTCLWLAFDFSFSICICQTHGHCRPLFACWWVVFFCIYCLLFGQSSFTVSWKILLLDVMASHLFFFFGCMWTPSEFMMDSFLAFPWILVRLESTRQERWRLKKFEEDGLEDLIFICYFVFVMGISPRCFIFFCILLCMCR